MSHNPISGSWEYQVTTDSCVMSGSLARLAGVSSDCRGPIPFQQMMQLFSAASQIVLSHLFIHALQYGGRFEQRVTFKDPALPAGHVTINAPEACPSGLLWGDIKVGTDTPVRPDVQPALRRSDLNGGRLARRPSVNRSLHPSFSNAVDESALQS